MSVTLTSTVFLKDLQVEAKRLIDILVEFPGYENKSRNCGFIFLKDTRNNMVLMHHSIGDVDSAPAEKVPKFRAFSEEKAQRLTAWKKHGHLSSWQTRNPNDNKWGGAVLCDNVILSFSGLPELGDEALCLVLGVRKDLISEKDARIIAVESSNPFFEPLLAAAA